MMGAAGPDGREDGGFQDRERHIGTKVQQHKTGGTFLEPSHGVVASNGARCSLQVLHLSLQLFSPAVVPTKPHEKNNSHTGHRKIDVSTCERTGKRHQIGDKTAAGTKDQTTK